MKKITQSLLLIVLSFWGIHLHGQWSCKEEVTIPLDPFTGTITISPEILIEGETDASLVLSKYDFDCYDVGNSIQIEVSELDSEENFCFLNVNIVDEISPTVVVDDATTIFIPKGEIEFLINPTLIDEGSFDNCAIKEMYVTPSKVTCSDIGSYLEVKLYVVDFSGNENYASTLVFVDGDELPSLKCMDDITMKYNSDRVLESFLFDRSENPCAKVVMEILDGNGIVIENNLLQAKHIGQDLTVTLTDENSGSQCNLKVYIEEYDCPPLLLCDTECNSTLDGDCDSGHTQNDNIEWPCDLNLDVVFTNFIDAYPETLIEKYGVEEKDAQPVFINASCFDLSHHFTDEYFNAEEGVKIIRHWTVYEWNTFEYKEYTQEILFIGNSEELIWNICDVEPNSAENGDCFSGKTKDDDIEWPDDIVARDHRIRPEELVTISNVDFEDSRPILVTNEEVYNLGYTDVIKQQTSNSILVERSWVVSSIFNSELAAEYVQKINFPIPEDASSIVSVTTHTGRPVPGVEVAEGIFTNDLGIARVAGGSLNPKLDDDPFNGIDLEDFYIIRKYIFGIRLLTPFQIYASDIYFNNTISTLDAVVILKILEQDLSTIVTDGWKLGWEFFESNQTSYLPIRASYIAFKYGDPNDSTPLGYSNSNLKAPENNFVFDDILLNKGEAYTIQIRLEKGLDLFGYQTSIHTKGLRILEVKSILENGAFNHNPIKDDYVKLVFVKNENTDQMLEDGSPVIEIKFESLVNSTLGDHFEIINPERSFVLTDSGEKLTLGKRTDNEISSGFYPVHFKSVFNVIPNPVDDIINFDVNPGDDFEVEIYNATGNKVLTNQKQKIYCGNWESGIYFFRGLHKGISIQGKFIVAH